jgi:hypothetical protein
MISYKIARKVRAVKLGKVVFRGVLSSYLYGFLVLFSQMNRIKFVADTTMRPNRVNSCFLGKESSRLVKPCLVPACPG